MHWPFHSFLGLLIFAATADLVNGFSFSNSKPTQCDNLTVTWSGAQTPLQLLMTPVFGAPRNISIPSASSSGSYHIQLPFSQNQRILLTMSDATGFGSGGTTEVLTVGQSLGGSCNTTGTALPFTFSLDGALQQCRPYSFSQYDGAVQPVTIYGIIPGGDSLVLNPPKGTTSFDWTADIAQGTSIVFLMTDADDQQGGSSDLLTVAITDDNSCLNGSSPSSTINPTSTSTSGPSPTSTNVVTTGPSAGTIAGAVLGALLSIAVLVTLGLFFLRRRKRDAWSNNNPSRRPSDRLGSHPNFVDSPHDNGNRDPSVYPYTMPSNSPGTTSTSQFLPSSDYDAQPFTLPPPLPPPSHPNSHHSFSLRSDDVAGDPASTSGSPAFDHETLRSSLTAAQRKAAIAGVSAYRLPRLVLHTDLEEGPSGAEGDLIELPPQYSDRRAPLPGLQANPTHEHPSNVNVQPLQPQITPDLSNQSELPYY